MGNPGSAPGCRSGRRSFRGRLDGDDSSGFRGRASAAEREPGFGNFGRRGRFGPRDLQIHLLDRCGGERLRGDQRPGAARERRLNSSAAGRSSRLASSKYSRNARVVAYCIGRPITSARPASSIRPRSFQGGDDPSTATPRICSTSPVWPAGDRPPRRAFRGRAAKGGTGGSDAHKARSHGAYSGWVTNFRHEPATSIDRTGLRIHVRRRGRRGRIPPPGHPPCGIRRFPGASSGGGLRLSRAVRRRTSVWRRRTGGFEDELEFHAAGSGRSRQAMRVRRRLPRADWPRDVRRRRRRVPAGRWDEFDRFRDHLDLGELAFLREGEHPHAGQFSIARKMQTTSVRDCAAANSSPEFQPARSAIRPRRIPSFR